MSGHSGNSSLSCKPLMWSVLIAATSFSLACCQSTAARPSVTLEQGRLPIYDVVSIKPNDSGSGSSHINAYETTFQATNISLSWLLVNAYGVLNNNVFGLPKWAEKARWDINAKVVDPEPKVTDGVLKPEDYTARYRYKIQAMLIDRYHLRAHTETRVLPTYELVLLPGPLRFARSTPDEDSSSGTRTRNRNLTATAITLKGMAEYLAGQVGRPVEDKTGLEGKYDFHMVWSSDELAEAAKDTGATDRPPGIYTALQEQLGLKLISGKGPAEVLVVDSVEPPAVD